MHHQSGLSSQYPSLRRRWRQIFTALAGALAIAAAGCVERLLRVRSEPPGAEVTVNGEHVTVVRNGKRYRAVTPVDIPIDFHGTYEITLRAGGRVSQSRLVAVKAPFYDYPPLDLLAEALVPWTIRETHTVTVELEPTPRLDDDETAALLSRIRALESRVEPAEGAGTAPPAGGSGS